jgi:uncharacterized membrane protein HdeD (DUF308 family)
MEAHYAHLAARWIGLLVRGGVAIAAGIAALFVSPAAAKGLLAVYLFVDGCLALSLAMRMGARRRARVFVAADGLADILVSLVLLFCAPSNLMLILVVAVWATATGILEIVAAIFLPRAPGFAWAIAIGGLVSCCVGIVAFDWTALAEMSLLYLFGTYAVITGILFLTCGVLLGRAFGDVFRSHG